MKEMVCFALAAGVGRDAVENTPPRPCGCFWRWRRSAGWWCWPGRWAGCAERCGPRRRFAVPQDLSSAQAGFLMDGEADDRDLLSLILVFARRGLVTVSSDEWDGSDPEQTPLVLTRRRDLPRTPPCGSAPCLKRCSPDGAALCHLTRPDDGFAARLEQAQGAAGRILLRRAPAVPAPDAGALSAGALCGCLALFLGLSRAGVGWALAACVPLVMLAFPDAHGFPPLALPCAPGPGPVGRGRGGAGHSGRGGRRGVRWAAPRRCGSRCPAFCWCWPGACWRAAGPPHRLPPGGLHPSSGSCSGIWRTRPGTS